VRGSGSRPVARTTGRSRTSWANAFDSIVALSQARAVAYDANADESRFLVDPDRAAQYQRAFTAKTRSLNGYHDTEMHNITFAGEREAAERVLTTFQQYQRDDQRIRAMGDLRQAIAFCVGTAPGNSNYDFAR